MIVYNALKIDPTRTAHLRNRFSGKLEAMFKSGKVSEAAIAQALEEAYRKGAERAYNDIRKPPLSPDLKVLAGARGEFLREVTKEGQSRIQQEAQRIARLIQEQREDESRGESRVRATAHTEIVKAFTLGQLGAFENLDIEDIGVSVEWTIAKGACPLCQELAGKRFKVSQAYDLLPYHPYCRCCFRPSNEAPSRLRRALLNG